MKKTKIQSLVSSIAFGLLLVSLLSSCMDSEQRLEYRYAMGNYMPDSAKAKYAEWITKTVSASNLHMTGGDYEDPEDVIQQAERTGERIFSIQVEGLEIRYTSNGWWVFIPKEKLNGEQLKEFELLKNSPHEGR